MNTKRNLIALAITAFFSLSAFAQTAASTVQRDVNQQKRIEQGIQSGQLTNKEVSKLERGQARVNRKEARTGADGHVGPAEQANIQNAENHQSKRVYKKKHNNNTP